MTSAYVRMDSVASAVKETATLSVGIIDSEPDQRDGLVHGRAGSGGVVRWQSGENDLLLDQTTGI